MVGQSDLFTMVHNYLQILDQIVKYHVGMGQVPYCCLNFEHVAAQATYSV